MPAVSEKQRRYFAMCHADPDKASCPKNMSKEQMHDFMHKAKKQVNKNKGSTQHKKRRHKGAVSKLMGQ